MDTLEKILFFVCLASLQLASGKRPHIVFMVADDLGWNDVGFHNPNMITPNIDKLAREGVILNQSYVQPVCTPSRNAFMSGIYPFKAGLQHLVIFPQQAACSPTNVTYLPQRLKNLGYATHMLGKWHLGFCKWECTPTYRGFDSFFGFYNGQETYYNHTVLGGKDFRDDKEAFMPDPTVYSTYVYADRAKQIIQNHDQSKPLFMYLAFQSVHEPIQVPLYYENMYSNIKNKGRRQYSGMVTAMDDLIGNITTALMNNGLYDETLIVFTADNGGWPTYYGNNFPLRGSKTTVFEGGTRASAFVWGSMLKKNAYTYNGMIHAVDWMPTINAAAGGEPVTGVDGVNQWENLRSGGPSNRKEFIYNLDDMFPERTGHAAIRVGDYKLISGYPGMYPDWYPPQNETSDYHIRELSVHKKFAYFGRDQLFNLRDDPYEHNDISWRNPKIVTQLKQRMAEYHKDLVPPNYPPADNASNPSNYNGFWTPGWC